jgi:hypothetical protein
MIKREDFHFYSEEELCEKRIDEELLAARYNTTTNEIRIIFFEPKDSCHCDGDAVCTNCDGSSTGYYSLERVAQKYRDNGWKVRTDLDVDKYHPLMRKNGNTYYPVTKYIYFSL